MEIVKVYVDKYNDLAYEFNGKYYGFNGRDREEIQALQLVEGVAFFPYTKEQVERLDIKYLRTYEFGE